MKKSILLTITFLLIAAATFAQSGKLKRANKHFEKGNYEKAFWLYYEVLDKNDNDEAKIKGAYACLKMKNYQDAEYWLGQVVHIENIPPEYLLYHAASLAHNYKCALADYWLEESKKINLGDTRIAYLEEIIESCDINLNLPIIDWNKIMLE